MKYKFLNENITTENLINNITDTKESILYENNIDQISKILDFLNSKNSILLTTGFLGTGKTAVIKHCLKALNEDAVTLWANCYESTNLDDIFLNFFEEFKYLASNNIIKIPQAKFESFSQRINAYFYSISKPILIIINSYQSLLPENAKLLLDFLEHLSEFKKIKTIIISRNFNIDTLSSHISYTKINFKALSKEIFQKYMVTNKIRLHGAVIEEFYKLTKGYYFYTTLALKIMNVQNLSLIELMQKQANSFLSLKEFLFREFLMMIDPIGSHLLRFLTAIRYPVNTKLLQTINLYDENRINMFAQNYIIEIDHGNIYLKDYYKEITETEIPNNVLIKLHKSCVELYEMQLPRKPEDRDLLISRKTIRQEIEYHRAFLPKKAEFTSNIEIYNSQALITKPIEIPTTKEKAPIPPAKKELKDLLFVFDQDEENSLLENIAESLNEFIEENELQSKLEHELNEENFLQLIKHYENDFEYKKIISLCEKSLSTKQNDDNFQALINYQMALAYSNLPDLYNAVKHFQIAKNLYQKSNNIEKISENNFYIAKMNYLMFKRKGAKSILNLIDIKNCPSPLQIKINLLLFDIYLEEGKDKDAFDICKKAMQLADKHQDPTTICELLFKCGLILETSGNTYRAIEAYEKALKFNQDIHTNKFLSQIYSNLTTLYAETNNFNIAQDYCQKALEIEIANNNLLGLYDTNMKLAQLSLETTDNNTETYFQNAFKYAQELNDNFYKISALTAYGDYFYDNSQIINALEKYFIARKLAKDNFVEENLQIIERRILDVKYRLDIDTFNKKAKEFNYEQ